MKKLKRLLSDRWHNLQHNYVDALRKKSVSYVQLAKDLLKQTIITGFIIFVLLVLLIVFIII